MKPWKGKHWLEQEKYLRNYKKPGEGMGMQIFQDGIICAWLRLQKALLEDWEEQKKETPCAQTAEKKKSGRQGLFKETMTFHEFAENERAKEFLEQHLNDIEIDWKQAALRFGEELATCGPNGYYSFTPQQWLDHALEQWKALTVGITILKPFHDAEKDVGQRKPFILQAPTQYIVDGNQDCKLEHPYTMSDPAPFMQPFHDEEKAESFTSSNENKPQVVDMEGQKWIPVSERLPEDGKTVLCYSKWGITIGHRWDSGQWVDEHVYELEDISHWMPLPTMPKPQEGE